MKKFITTFSIAFATIFYTNAQDINSKTCIEWWQMCNDPTLQELITWAVENNSNIVTASNNILLARSNWKASQAGFYPSLSINAGYISEKTSQGITYVDKRDQIGEATINATWEIDIFGAIRKNAQSKKATFIASEQQYNAVMISLCGQVVEEYAKLRALQRQLTIAQQNLESQQAISNLTEQKFQNGLTTALDAAQSKSLLLQTQASIPGIVSSITSQKNTLMTLIGKQDSIIENLLLIPDSLGNPPLVVFNGVEAQAIQHRPDIMQAESQLKALIKAAGATKADYWPKFFVTAEFGYGSHQFSHFTEYENMVWQVEPAIKWDIFSGGQVIQAKRAAMVQVDEGVNNLNKAIRNALQDIENGLTDLKAAQEQYIATKAALEQLQLTYNLAKELYDDGLADYQSVMSSQQSLLSMEESYTNAQLALWQATAALYIATGGGWNLNR